MVELSATCDRHRSLLLSLSEHCYLLNLSNKQVFRSHYSICFIIISKNGYEVAETLSKFDDSSRKVLILHFESVGLFFSTLPKLLFSLV